MIGRTFQMMGQIREDMGIIGLLVIVLLLSVVTVVSWPGWAIQRIAERVDEATEALIRQQRNTDHKA